MPKARPVRKGPEPAPYDAAQAKKNLQKKPTTAKGQKQAKKTNPLFVARPRTTHVRKTRDLTHFVKWPRMVRIQRQKRVLAERLKVPPVINQFTNTVPKGVARQLFSLGDKYKPETKLQKKQRLAALAEARTKDPKAQSPPPPPVLKYGINHITALVEQKEAKLVLIAHDVDPIEIVVWLPTLCRKMGVPFAIVKGKARLGQLVDKKTATAVAFKNINKADEAEFASILRVVDATYNGEEADKLRRKWGGNKLGPKDRARHAKAAKSAKTN